MASEMTYNSAVALRNDIEFFAERLPRIEAEKWLKYMQGGSLRHFAKLTFNSSFVTFITSLYSFWL